VVGPVIILIGLSLSGSAVNMAKDCWILAFASLLTAVGVLTFCKGMMKLVPIISGVIVGYIVAVCMGKVDFSGVASASWIACPVTFDTLKHFEWSPFLYMIPVAIAPVIEHIGDVYAVGAVAQKDFVKEPGLHRTMLGDGVACLTSAVNRDAKANIQQSFAIFTALPDKDRPINIMTGPTTTGGNIRSSNFFPCHFTNALIAK
jgi:uracil permease